MSCKSASPILAISLLLSACHSGPAVTTFDGIYLGEAVNVSPPVYNCQSSTTTAPMNVADGRVSFGLFRGWVGSEGAVQIQSQQNTLSGQFSNNRFNGQFQEGLYYVPWIFYTYQLNMFRI